MTSGEQGAIFDNLKICWTPGEWTAGEQGAIFVKLKTRSTPGERRAGEIGATLMITTIVYTSCK